METIKSNISGAIRRTLKEEMENDPDIFLLGEDIADPYGGIHNVTRGLSTTFGKERVVNSPLSEIAIIGTGIGAAISGMRPVVEIMYADFLTITMDQIINNAAKMHFLSHGRINVPLVIRANFGCGTGEGAQHSQTPEAWFLNIPGLKIVAPSTPRDAQGLLKSSIYDNNPVLFFEHKLLYVLQGEILKENVAIPLGKGEIKKEGIDLTIVASSLMVQRSLRASKELEEEGYSVEVIDVRTLKPLDEELIFESVQKTGKLLVVEENPYTGGWGAQVVQSVATERFSSLKIPPARLTTPDVPLPVRKDFEDYLVPGIENIKEKVIEMLKIN